GPDDPLSRVDGDLQRAGAVHLSGPRALRDVRAARSEAEELGRRRRDLFGRAGTVALRDEGHQPLPGARARVQLDRREQMEDVPAPGAGRDAGPARGLGDRRPSVSDAGDDVLLDLHVLPAAARAVLRGVLLPAGADADDPVRAGVLPARAGDAARTRELL